MQNMRSSLATACRCYMPYTQSLACSKETLSTGARKDGTKPTHSFSAPDRASRPSISKTWGRSKDLTKFNQFTTLSQPKALLYYQCFSNCKRLLYFFVENVLFDTRFRLPYELRRFRLSRRIIAIISPSVHTNTFSFFKCNLNAFLTYSWRILFYAFLFWILEALLFS